MIMTDEQFTQLMLHYLEGTASRTERIELMTALAESDELCSLFNSCMALERMTAEAEEEEDTVLTDDNAPFTTTGQLQN